MGVTVAAALKHAGHEVLWISERRSAATRARAEQVGLRDAEFITALCQQAEVIVSVCPPATAEDVARSVASRKFAGLFIDANAIAPERARRIGKMIEGGGGQFVDGGIIGPPARQPKTTWLHLSGAAANEAAALFSGSLIEAVAIGDEIGKASALKMCYAAYSKGSTALLAAVVAAADALGVREELFAQWSQSNADVSARIDREIPVAAAKAWRFVSEMEEIAATLRAAGVPGGFHDAARDVYARLAEFKNAASPPSQRDILTALLRAP
jgi:3-hydroxyisobutyrate dehydrogenase-like beta-hydroxyacid dehydrogenase